LETAVGVKAKVDAIADIKTLLPGGLLEPPIVTKIEQQPHASLVVMKDQRGNLLSSGNNEIDYRRVKVTVFGTDKAAVARAGAAIDAALSEQELTIENADWMRTEPVPELRGGVLERAAKTQDGVHWQARLEYRVWTSRPKTPSS
jgi:hypothetical protein